MTTAAPARLEALRRAADRARLAPSIHNTQPWRFAIGPDGLELYSDAERRLHVIDPLGRQLLLSCGCALLNARASLAADGYDAQVERFPDESRPDLLARITLGSEYGDRPPLSALDAAIPQRHTNRRQFADEPVPTRLIQTLIDAATAEQAVLLAVTSPEHRAVVAELVREANRIEEADPAYRMELATWTTDDLRRRDGVPASAVPYGHRPGDSDLPIRDFDPRGMGWLPGDPESDRNQCLLLLASTGNDRASWLRAGEGLERVLLAATRAAYAVSPFSQIVEVAQTNRRLCQDLELDVYPQLLLRLGRAPAASAVPRRPLEEMLTETS
jgi:nitroreductase